MILGNRIEIRYTPDMAPHITFYKQAIAKQAKNLEAIKDRTGWGPAAKIKLELQLQQSFYALWKLLKDGLMPESFTCVEIPMKAFAYKHPKVASGHYRQLKRYYNLSEPLPVTHDAHFIANQFVHNAVFDISQDMDKRLFSVYVTSDQQVHMQLYEIAIRDVIELLEEASITE